MIMCEL